MSTIPDGGRLGIDPGAVRRINVDWNASLDPGVTIVTSTFQVLAVIQRGATPLLATAPVILSGGRMTQVLLDALTLPLGDRYTVTNTIVTSAPVQTIPKSFDVVIEDTSVPEALVTLDQAKSQLHIPLTTTARDAEIQDLADRASAMVIRHLNARAVAGWSTGSVLVPGGVQTATLELIAQLDAHRGDEAALDGGWKDRLIPFRDPTLA